LLPPLICELPASPPAAIALAVPRRILPSLYLGICSFSVKIAHV
jgi:hypothetical protein